MTKINVGTYNVKSAEKTSLTLNKLTKDKDIPVESALLIATTTNTVLLARITDLLEYMIKDKEEQKNER